MMRIYIAFLLVIACISVISAQTPAFPGAEGFGAFTKGGRGGDVYHVTTLWDSGAGSLREGITTATGPRTIVFDVSGTIELSSNLKIEKPFITIAGQTAPGDGICVRDYSILINKTNDIIIRYMRFRRGDVRVRADGKPTGSTGLDVISIDDSKNIIIDHCSLSWSCDEIFGIVQNQNVTVQWCIISEPLGDPILHPYGTEHAYGMNNSATTLSVHHNLLANYVMRGPNFEVNDASSAQGYHVYKEAVNNVLFDYKKSGSRYTCGIETNPGGAYGIDFRFHYIKNKYITSSSYSKAQEIQATTKYGITDQLKVHVSGNIGPHRTSDNSDQWSLVFIEGAGLIRDGAAEVKAQMSDQPLFTVPKPVTTQRANDAYFEVLDKAGCNLKRDAVDKRIVANVTAKKYSDYLLSQDEVGGWPELKTEPAPLDTDKDGMPDSWETTKGFNINDATDRNSDADANGYTNLEDYLNRFDLVTSAQTIQKPGIELNVFPNPADSDINITFSVAETHIAFISVYDENGRKVWNTSAEIQAHNTQSKIINSGSLNTGCYWVVLEAGNNRISKKFVKTRK